MAEERITKIKQLADVYTKNHKLLGDDMQSVYGFAIWLDKHKEILFKKGATALDAFKMYVNEGNPIPSVYWTADFADYVHSFSLHVTKRL